MSTSWAILQAEELTLRGITRKQRRRLIDTGRLRRVGQGIYLDGPLLDGAAGWYQQVAIAWAPHRDGAVSEQAAAALYELDGFEPGVPIAIQVGSRAGASTTGVRRLQRLRDPIRIGSVQVCGIDETLLGLGADLVPRPGCAAAHTSLDAVELVELAVEAALRLELTTVERLREICHDAARNRPGRAVLQEVLRIRPEGAAPAESYLETRCVQVLRSGGVADFERQVVLQDSCGPIGRVDLRLGHVVIEVVGWVAHHDKLDPDSYRYARLTAAGFYVLPFTFRQIEFDPNHIVNATKAALGGRPGGE